MKSFVISILLFLLVLGTIAVNAVYVSSFCDGISNTARKLPSSQEKDALIAELKENWDKHRIWLDFSIKLSEIERMNDLIESLDSAHKSNNPAEFSKYCTLIDELAQEFADHEKISLRSIC